MKNLNRSPFRTKARNYRVENKAATETTMYLYDEIGWFGVSAEQFVKDLNAITTPTIHLRINSPGGSVFDGVSIANSIKQHKSKVITHIDGLAASIASIIAIAGSEVRIAENAFLMIHEPWSIVIGTSEDMRQEAELLDKVGGTIAKTYMNKTGKSEEEILNLMAAETWMTGNEAFEMGFVDVVEEDPDGEQAKAGLFDLSVFANVPDKLKGNEEHNLTEREIEKALRDAGLTQRQAKAILAEGLHPHDDDLQRDAANQPERDVQDHVEAKPKVDEPVRDVQGPKPKARDWVEDLLFKADNMVQNLN